jgi:hypothetical protein
LVAAARALLAPRARKETQAHKVLLAPKDQWVLLVRREHQVQLALKDQRVLPGLWVHPDHQFTQVQYAPAMSRRTSLALLAKIEQSSSSPFRVGAAT